jgi:hypothetical protein
MTAQIPDEVRFRGQRYAITAVEGTGLFSPDDHGLEPVMLSTAAWRGFVALYAVRHGRLFLDQLETGRPPGPAPRLLGVKPRRTRSLRYERLRAPMSFTGRLLVGARDEHVGYLNMGFYPAWLYRRVWELRFTGGRLTRCRNRSAELATLRERLGPAGLKFRNAAETSSLSFAYSWPTPSQSGGRQLDSR